MLVSRMYNFNKDDIRTFKNATDIAFFAKDITSGRINIELFNIKNGDVKHILKLYTSMSFHGADIDPGQNIFYHFKNFDETLKSIALYIKPGDGISIDIQHDVFGDVNLDTIVINIHKHKMKLSFIAAVKMSAKEASK